MMNTRNKWGSRIEFGVFVVPAMVCILISAIIPFMMSMYYSLTKWNGVGKHIKFIGLKNFKELLTSDTNALKALVFTLEYTLLAVVLTNVIAILLAVVLTKALKLRGLYRTAFFVPYIISLIIIGFIWRFMFTKGFDVLYSATGWELFQWSWLGNAHLAFWSILFVGIWQSVGFYMMIYITGLQSVPGDLLEAASIDGCVGISRFFKITLPLLMPSITVALFLSLANSLKVFDIIYTLTFGGPGGATNSITIDIYNEAFVNNRFGYATAKSLVFVVLILLITIIQVRFTKSREVEA
ncbi:carbohydrate ABC transporter permease [Paenibacillus lignilyticus]|uniref:Sugar ABC transporter permease n=1 Tax=Paenibacillus lignilyticus TaxID=1172615 RepID=A0ABS5CEL1_9BACL|nr:sugar ABC transporter permease [Paenibacillus lignilyticus]MBP3964305.1 sugar ABC transporter permease [Paenibacillus lignilyticus]